MVNCLQNSVYLIHLMLIQSISLLITVTYYQQRSRHQQCSSSCESPAILHSSASSGACQGQHYAPRVRKTARNNNWLSADKNKDMRVHVSIYAVS